MSALENLTIKQPIRRLEIQINNFNVAIPHHVDLLQRHRNNIIKYKNQHDWEKVRREHTNVSRIIKQLKELLYQMDTLRAQVLDVDIEQFDKLTANARTSIMNAIREYLEMELTLSLSPPESPVSENEEAQHPLESSSSQLQMQQEDLEHQQDCLNVWNSLQGDIQQLHELFVEFDKVVHDQREMIVSAENNVEETQVNVSRGTTFLQKASKYKAAAYPLAGAMLGTCIGGPVGLVAGLKIGGLTALGCGILGFTGGSFLRKKQIKMHSLEADSNESVTNAENVKKSSSCPENLEMDKKQS